MQIHGATHVHGPQSINAPHATRGAQGAEAARPSADVRDELHLSETAQIASQLNEIPDIRQDRVQALRAAIANGTYETNEKLDVALERLLDEIG